MEESYDNLVTLLETLKFYLSKISLLVNFSKKLKHLVTNYTTGVNRSNLKSHYS